VFLAQYFQVARDHTPTEAGLLMLPLIVGNMVGATGTGQYITRTGRWKGIMLVGAFLAVLFAVLTGSPWGGLAAAIVGGAALGGLHALLTVRLNGWLQLPGVNPALTARTRQ